MQPQPVAKLAPSNRQISEMQCVLACEYACLHTDSITLLCGVMQLSS